MTLLQFLYIVMTAIYCFNASISLGKNSYKEHSSMRSYDDGDAMSDIVSPVIAGF
ncbi:DUF1672 family protein [Staphylococcus pettenkoferi]|uniref:DUF1672 family protein n=1 Tax=Staphylococcus pettenkoferi TaxID=170573 RepID=UPI0039F6E67A